MKPTKVDVLVLGGGVVGVALARELQKSGRQVVLIDKGEPGFGCSYGNAGWITPCFSMPLPQPGMFLKALGWLRDPESPLYIKPDPSLALMRWLWAFMKAMNQRQLRNSIDALTAISKESLKLYGELAVRRPDSFGYESKGLLMVSATRDGLAAAETEMRLMAERGIPGEVLSADAVLAREPALRPGLLGGVYFPAEAHAEPLGVVQALLAEFKETGGIAHSRTEAYDFISEGNELREVVTTRGTFQADLVVLATGSWSRSLASRLGVRVPILGGKGYALITDSFEVKPQHPIMILERKIAVTPRRDTVRLAGTLELVRDDESLTPRRVNAILKGSMSHLRMSADPVITEVWRGLRPCTPDGVPMIGFSGKWKNLFYNVGHQMLGLQSATGSARLAAELIAGKTPYTDPRPFRAERFE